MARGFSIALGIGLGLLWLTGFNSPAAARWLVWADLVGAIFSFVIAATLSPNRRPESGVGALVALSIGLFGLWLVGLSTGVVPWLVWWNFIFACAYLGVAMGSATSRVSPRDWRSFRSSGGVGAAGNWPVDYYGAAPPFPMDTLEPVGTPWKSRYARPSASWRGPRNYQRTDDRIREDLNERLAHNWSIDPSDVEVLVEAGVVTLTGSVATRHERRVAEAIADSVFGVTDVRNELRIEIQGGETGPTRAA